MNVNVYGCGFAGLATSAGLASSNISINSVEKDPQRLNKILSSEALGFGGDLDTELRKKRAADLKFYLLGNEPVHNIDSCIVTVPTPLNETTNVLDLEQVTSCVEYILKTINFKSLPLLIVRSTLPIGGLSALEKKIFLEQGLASGIDYKIFYVPEFMREGQYSEDWKNPPLSVIGSDYQNLPDIIYSLFPQKNQIEHLNPRDAEILKLASNTFHGLKVGFANEVMRICSSHNVNPHAVMKAFCQDTKLNISSHYLTPGLPWGGSCLGKDISSLTQGETDTPIISAISLSNSIHHDFFLQKIADNNFSRIGFFDLGFKDGVYDFRESPLLSLAISLKNLPSVSQVMALSHSFQDRHSLFEQTDVEISNDENLFFSSDLIVVRKSQLEKISQYKMKEDHFFVVDL